VSEDPKDLSPAQIAVRVAFACAITLITAIAAYYGLLWLIGT
jgi:hypothetical protein